MFITRRDFLATSALAAGGALRGFQAPAAETTPAPAQNKARIAVTLDLEMSRNFPRWEDVHWDYEKGNLDEAAKQYTAGVARRVKAHGGTAHFFLVGRTLEQENIDWLTEIVAAGHSVGNHTYDHINIKATKPADIQFRFRRAPWLIEGQAPAQVIRENVRLATAAIASRLGVANAGFRTPGGFANGLADRPDLQQMFLDLGFKWVSAKYPPHASGKPGMDPTQDVFDGIAEAQAAAQPFVYPGGLIEIPMSPISDIGAFRNGRWKLEHFLTAIRLSLEWAIEHRAVFDFISHPSCLGVVDPEFKTIELICETVARAGNRAAFVTLDQVAEETSPTKRKE